MNWVMIVAVVSAFIIKGMCGFANTLVFSTILSYSTNNINISPIELIVGYPANVIIAWKERKSVTAKVCVPLALLVILGSIPGILFLKNGNTQVIKIIFGFVVFLLGIEMFFREYRQEKSKSSPAVLAIIGIISGLLCGLFGIGALLAAYVSRTTENNSSFKGNLCVVFIIENTFRIVLYSVSGIITLSILKSAIYLIPFMLLGLLIGIGLAKIFNEKVVKRAVIILLILSGISLIINNLII